MNWSVMRAPQHEAPFMLCGMGQVRYYVKCGTYPHHLCQASPTVLTSWLFLQLCLQQVRRMLNAFRAGDDTSCTCFLIINPKGRTKASRVDARLTMSWPHFCTGHMRHTCCWTSHSLKMFETWEDVRLRFTLLPGVVFAMERWASGPRDQPAKGWAGEGEQTRSPHHQLAAQH